MSVITAENVSIRYITGDFKDIGLKEFVMRKMTNNYHIEEFWADRNVTFTLEQGDMLGIIGTNGAGKSTLLKAISGIMVPTEGYITCEGKIAALLELASGFDGDLTVRENTFLRGALLGYTREFMEEKYDEIISFAELEDFQNHAFKQLSSGMKSRLAFSIGCLVDPDILILDEVLSVGDGAFREKSANKMKQILARGVTGLLVSHSLDQVRQLCNKVLWLDHGKQIAFGPAKAICDAYMIFLDTPKEQQRLPANEKEIQEISDLYRVSLKLDNEEKKRIEEAKKAKRTDPAEAIRKNEDNRLRRERLMAEAKKLPAEKFNEYLYGKQPAPAPAAPKPAPAAAPAAPKPAASAAPAAPAAEAKPQEKPAKPKKPKRVRPEGSRELWIDLLKIIACYAVIIIHSTGWLYTYKFENAAMFGWLGTVFQQSVTRFAVPCFMMLSGAFALSSKRNSMKDVIRRILTVAVPGLIWSFFYILINKESVQEIRNAILSLPFTHAEGHLWYLYFLVKLYLLAPILVGLYGVMTERQKQTLIALTLLIPAAADHLLRISGLSAIISGSGSVLTVGWQRFQLAELGIVFLGKYLYDLLTVQKRKFSFPKTLLASVLSCAYMMFTAYVCTMNTGKLDFSAYEHLRLPALLFGVSVLLLFASAKPVIDQMHPKAAKLVEKMGSITLEVYLSHILVMKVCEKFHLRTTDLLYHGGAGLRSTFLDGVIVFIGAFALAAGIDYCTNQCKKLMANKQEEKEEGSQCQK